MKFGQAFPGTAPQHDGKARPSDVKRDLQHSNKDKKPNGCFTRTVKSCCELNYGVISDAIQELEKSSENLKKVDKFLNIGKKKFRKVGTGFVSLWARMSTQVNSD